MWLRKLKNELVFQSQKARTDIGFILLRKAFAWKNEKGRLPEVEEAETILSGKYSSKRIISLNEENFKVCDNHEWGSTSMQSLSAAPDLQFLWGRWP